LTRFGADAFLTGQDTYDWPNWFRTARRFPAVEYLLANRLRHKLIQDMGALMKTVDVFVATGGDQDTLFLAATKPDSLVWLFRTEEGRV